MYTVYMLITQRKLTSNRLVSNYALLLPNKGAKSRLRGIKQKKIQIIPMTLDLDLF